MKPETNYSKLSRAFNTFKSGLMVIKDLYVMSNTKTLEKNFHNSLSPPIKRGYSTNPKLHQATDDQINTYVENRLNKESIYMEILNKSGAKFKNKNIIFEDVKEISKQIVPSSQGKQDSQQR